MLLPAQSPAALPGVSTRAREPRMSLPRGLAVAAKELGAREGSVFLEGEELDGQHRPRAPQSQSPASEPSGLCSGCPVGAEGTE